MKNFFPGKAVKGNIELYRVEVFGVKLKPPFLRKIRRIEGPVPPMGIIVTARPDQDFILNRGIRNAEFGICRNNLGFALGKIATLSPRGEGGGRGRIR